MRYELLILFTLFMLSCKKDDNPVSQQTSNTSPEFTIVFNLANEDSLPMYLHCAFDGKCNWQDSALVFSYANGDSFSVKLFVAKSVPYRTTRLDSSTESHFDFTSFYYPCNGKYSTKERNAKGSLTITLLTSDRKWIMGTFQGVLKQLSSNDSLTITDGSFVALWSYPTGSFPNGIIPLKIGNTWTYRETNFNPNGSVSSVTQYGLIVTKDTIAQNERWFQFSSGSWGRNSQDGLLLNMFHSWDDIVLAYKYTATVGDMCEALDYVTTKVISTNDVISVPKGSFSCYKYQSNRTDFPDNRLEMIEWFSPNIGLVRKEEWGLGYLSSVSELTAYTLN